MTLPSIKNKLFFSKKLSPNLKEIKKDLNSKATHSITENDLDSEELNIMKRIQSETRKRNLNNVTRTQSYLHFYKRFPEIHWAFLGHMVSRNGGWNMTDLKGDLLSKLLSPEEQKDYFIFLERGNWLIFHDIFPQLLLYEECVKRQKNLFYLLPIFDVSVFMRVIWDHFFRKKDEYLLTIALVINEQSYLEKRVIQNAHYKNTVLQTIEFKFQDLLSLNQILFPYEDQNEVKVIGETIHHFSSLHERILLGKRLYDLLFDVNKFHLFFDWATQQDHTGSRKDYWPHLFNDINESVPGNAYKRRLNHCRLNHGSNRIYSPRLKYAWKDINHDAAKTGDWFSDWRVLQYIEESNLKVNGDIQDEYCETLERIELSILAKETFL